MPIHASHNDLLHRHTIACSDETPWGIAQDKEFFEDGVEFYETSSHGGFLLSEAKNEIVDESWRNPDRWYEEDCEWAKVAYTFPRLFLESVYKQAVSILKNYHPDAYEKVSGEKIREGESMARNRVAFSVQHQNDYVVISAIHSKYEKATVECIATLGGDRQLKKSVRFLVPSSEYKIGKFGFVIDPRVHLEYNGPSSFAGWNS